MLSLRVTLQRCHFRNRSLKIEKVVWKLKLLSRDAESLAGGNGIQRETVPVTDSRIGTRVDTRSTKLIYCRIALRRESQR